MGGKGSFFIMLLIVAFLSLALAVMAGLFFFTSNSNTDNKEKVEQKEPKTPKEADLNQMIIESKPFNLKSSVDNDGVSYIQISATIEYFKTIEDVETLNTEEKMTLNKSAIMEMFNKQFMAMTLEDINAENSMDKTRKELVKKINEYLVANEKYKVDIVYTIHFSEWLYQ